VFNLNNANYGSYVVNPGIYSNLLWQADGIEINHTSTTN
jgi:hypothetical protein